MILLNIKLFGNSSFSLNTLDMTTHSILDPMVSDKLAVNTEDPLYVMSALFLATFKFLFALWQFDYDVSRCGSLWVYPPWSLLSFLDVWINVFIEFSRFLGIIFSNICSFFLLSLWNIHYVVRWCAWWCPTGIWGSFISLHSFYSLNCIISIKLSSGSWILSSPVQNLCWIPVVNFSFQLMYFPTITI